MIVVITLMGGKFVCRLDPIVHHFEDFIVIKKSFSKNFICVSTACLLNHWTKNCIYWRFCGYNTINVLDGGSVQSGVEESPILDLTVNNILPIDSVIYYYCVH